MARIPGNTLSAEVKQVGPFWFQLTGKKIVRETGACADILQEFERMGCLEQKALLVGVHDVLDDSDDEGLAPDTALAEREFGVVRLGDGSFRMYLGAHRAEFALLSFLVPHESGEDVQDPTTPFTTFPAA